MASKFNIKTTFEPAKTIEPIYTGGDVSSDASGRWLATCVDEDVLIVDVESAQPVARIEGDGEAVTSLCLSPSASHVVICSRSLSMRIYALDISKTLEGANPTLLRTLKPHSSPVVSLAIDESNTLVATGGADSTVKVWDLRGGFPTHTFHGHSGVVASVCFFRQDTIPDTKRKGRRRSLDNGDVERNGNDAEQTIYLASGGEDGSIRIWSLSTRKSVALLQSHVSVVRSLAYSARQQALLSASRDKTMIIWDSRSWQPRKVIPALEVLESARFLADGEWCCSGGEYGVVRIWSTATGQEVTEKQKPGSESDAIVALVTDWQDSTVMSIHQDQTIRIQSTSALQDLRPNSTIKPLIVLRRISGNHDEIIDMACVGHDRSLLALATNTESIRILSIRDQTRKRKHSSDGSQQPQSHFGRDVALLSGHEDIIICLDVDWSGHWLATGAKDNNARLWRLDPSTSSYTCFAAFTGHAESIGAIALPQASAAQNTTAFRAPVNHPPPFLLTGSQDRTIKRWDTSKLPTVSQSSPLPSTPHTQIKTLYTRLAHEKDINAIDVSPNTTTISLFASASQDRTIKIWSLEDGSVTAILRGHKRGVWSVKFSPASAPPLNLADGGTSGSRGLLASASGDRTVKVWSLSTYTCLLTFEGHSNSVLKIIWLAEPKVDVDDDDEGESARSQHQKHPIIASASSDTLIKLWDPYAPPTSDHLLTTLDNHSDRVWALASPSTTLNDSPTPNVANGNTTSKTRSSATQYPLISGAADARITFWTDTTSQTLTQTRKAASARIEQDQALQNYIHAKNYREVITLALTLNHPGRLLHLFEDVLALPLDERDHDSITGRKEVDDVLGNLGREQLYKLLERCRDWNTNARTAPVAQRVLNVVLKKYPRSVFVDMSKDRRLGREEGSLGKGGSGGMRDLLRALEVYTERHYKRMEELVDESWMLEYTLREMDEIAGTVGMDVNGDGSVDAEPRRDVVMT